MTNDQIFHMPLFTDMQIAWSMLGIFAVAFALTCIALLLDGSEQ